ncbi:hypothetical protein QBC33DRAFT_512938 [Phialemonium atrogriseum]|uniref:Uncharacterized protein n=1 Tax=Phialemonium atrogriseum TaxID=1093897 RepID=A0AAJ0C639_9PEZI|nr:uncharacterized protein QBC33DRAFT_512938 [Phialemonium atrogriseum]KAK1769417.1 hypothetical protein QBC33DRAFT_512938 [Phialemonium atrogriseum]
MAPTRPDKKKANARAKKARRTTAAAAAAATSPRQLLAEATARLEQGDVGEAARLAEEACERSTGAGRGAALTLLGEIRVEAGEMAEARACFLRAVEAAGGEEGDDDDGHGDDEGGAEKFLWLAQLCEEGGRESVTWFERGAAVLRRQIGRLGEEVERAVKRAGAVSSSAPSSSAAAAAAAPSSSTPTITTAPSPAAHAAQTALDEKKRKLAETLCAVAEVYMTDLSWEADAEGRCEALVTEAGLLAPDHAGAWQTLANVRISQGRAADARAALERSMELWEGLAPEDSSVPAFPARIGLARLLIEVDMEERAVEVVERLVSEDDESVEAWYLGGYGLFALGEKLKENAEGDVKGQDDSADDWKAVWRSARRWLAQCLLLFQAQEYEDQRLGEHAQDLLETIKGEIGDAVEGEDEEDDGWEDTDGGEDADEDADEDGDEEMK